MSSPGNGASLIDYRLETSKGSKDQSPGLPGGHPERNRRRAGVMSFEWENNNYFKFVILSLISLIIFETSLSDKSAPTVTGNPS